MILNGDACEQIFVETCFGRVILDPHDLHWETSMLPVYKRGEVGHMVLGLPPVSSLKMLITCLALDHPKFHGKGKEKRR